MKQSPILPAETAAPETTAPETTATESASSVIWPLLALVGLLAAAGLSFLTFGPAGLALPLLALVPVLFGVLIWISAGKL